MPKKYFPGFLLIFLSACSTVPVNSYSTVIDAIPMGVKPIEAKAVTDAVAGTKEKVETPKAVVTFHVERVISGDFTERRGGSSRLDQISDSVKDKDFFGALNHKNPNERIPKEWVSVAVDDPGKWFGLDLGKTQGEQPFRLYLLKVKGKEGSYILTRAIPRKRS